jgi:hypothetical protein
MMPSIKWLFLVAVCLAWCAGAGCATTKPKKADSKAKTQQEHRVVGTIVVVNEEQRFVLIDTQAAVPPEVGTALKSFSNGAETGVLAVSPERKPPFMIADIVSGTPRKGDQVFE